MNSFLPHLQKREESFLYEEGEDIHLALFTSAIYIALVVTDFKDVSFLSGPVVFIHVARGQLQYEVQRLLLPGRRCWQDPSTGHCVQRHARHEEHVHQVAT